MRLVKKALGDAVLLQVSGSIMFADTSTLKTALHRLAKEGKKKIIVDISAMDSLNSQALASFLSGYKMLRDGTIAFAGANPHVARVFQVAKLDDLFPMFDSVEQAATSLNA
ncbi:MAG: STAS domain-containing protein [Candidatus Omnitrophota bacterium]